MSRIDASRNLNPSDIGIVNLNVLALSYASLQAGDGFMYPSGQQAKPAFNIQEAEHMLKSPTTRSVNQQFYTSVIKSSVDYAQSVSASASIQAAGWGASLKSKLVASKSSVSQATSLCFSTYTRVISALPTQMEGCPALTEPAKNTLQESGPDVFKQEYGSHFVYGFYSSADARAEVTISTTSSSEKNSLAESLSLSYQDWGVTAGGSANFSANVAKYAGHSEIQTSVSTTGVTDAPRDASIQALGDYIFHLQNHTTNDSDRAVLVLYPHSFCTEYNRIVQHPPILPAAYGNDELLTAWAQLQYDQRSYKAISQEGPDALNMLIRAKLRKRIDNLTFPIRDLLASNTGSSWLNDTEVRKIHAISDEAEEVSYSLQKVSDNVRALGRYLNGMVVFENVHALGRYLNVAGDEIVNGAHVVLWDNPMSTSTQWQIHAIGDGTYTISNVNAVGKYLNVADDVIANGANIVLWDNPMSTSTQWQIHSLGDGTYTISNVNAVGKYLNVAADEVANGAHIVLWDNPASTSTQWRIREVSAIRAQQPSSRKLFSQEESDTIV
jgi:hypothetical protein